MLGYRLIRVSSLFFTSYSSIFYFKSNFPSTPPSSPSLLSQSQNVDYFIYVKPLNFSPSQHINDIDTYTIEQQTGCNFHITTPGPRNSQLNLKKKYLSPA